MGAVVSRATSSVSCVQRWQAGRIVVFKRTMQCEITAQRELLKGKKQSLSFIVILEASTSFHPCVRARAGIVADGRRTVDRSGLSNSASSACACAPDTQYRSRCQKVFKSLLLCPVSIGYVHICDGVAYRRMFTQLVKGCGDLGCDNPHCATGSGKTCLWMYCYIKVS